MEIAEIVKDWSLKTRDKQAAVEWWDSMAGKFGERPLPSFAQNEFLKLLEAKGMLSEDADILDVGCGAGGHALAIAARCQSVTGFDLSPQMIEAAKRRASELQVENAQFSVVDWHEFDAEEAGFREKFDLVYAHMTPAIQGYETFQKLSECSRGWCAMVKPIKRYDKVHDAILSMIGAEKKAQVADSDVLKAFMLLFAQERYPMIEYNRRCSEMKYPLEKALSVYINRTKSSHTLTPEQEECIKDYLHSIARDGIVEGFMDTTVATLYWHV